MAALTIPEVQAIQAQLATMQSKRVRLMKGLEALLKTITTAKGYTTNVESVSFDVKSWRDLPADQTPVIYIVDGSTQITRHAGCIREYVWKIELFGCVKDKDFISFEEFISDVEQCIYDNRSLFGEVNKMEIVDIVTDNQLFSEINGNGSRLYSMFVDLEFTRKVDNSR